MKLIIEQAGFSVSWVDMGRRFAQEQGFCQSGAMDWFNFALANAICGNPANTPALEVFAGQCVIYFDQDTAICISGARATILVDNIETPLNKLIFVKAGQRVSIESVKHGLYNYIAITAQVRIPRFKDSVCAVKKEKKGGYYQNGESLREGDFIELIRTKTIDESQIVDANRRFNLPPYLQQLLSHYYLPRIRLPICLCYQSATFDSQEITRLLNSEYKLSTSIDKMGVRLIGPSIRCTSRTLQSQALAKGAVQITGEGQAIIMRNERQTMGGYPVIGVVNMLGLMVLSQATPNDKVVFELSNFQDASVRLNLIRASLSRLSAKQHKILDFKERI